MLKKLTGHVTLCNTMVVSASGIPPVIGWYSLESDRKSAPISNASDNWDDKSSKGRLFIKSNEIADNDVPWRCRCCIGIPFCIIPLTLNGGWNECTWLLMQQQQRRRRSSKLLEETATLFRLIRFIFLWYIEYWNGYMLALERFLLVPTNNRVES